MSLCDSSSQLTREFVSVLILLREMVDNRLSPSSGIFSLCCLKSLSDPEDRNTSSELSISTKSLSYSEVIRDSGTGEEDVTVSVVSLGFSSADSKLLRKFPGFPKKSPNLFQKWGFTLSSVQSKNVLPINLAGTLHFPYLIKTNTSSLCKKNPPNSYTVLYH